MKHITFPFSYPLLNSGSWPGLNFYVHGKSVDGMNAQGIFRRFWTETQFFNKRNCGGSVQKLLKIASAVLAQECRTHYLCTKNQVTASYTRSRQRLPRHVSAGANTGLSNRKQNLRSMFCKAEWSLCHRLWRNGVISAWLRKLASSVQRKAAVRQKGRGAIFGDREKGGAKKLKVNRTSKQRDKK